MISKVLRVRLSSDVEELLWSSCCKHETFAKWVVGDGTAEGRNGGDDEDIDRAEFEGVISKVLALRLPGYVEELLWIDFCGHESFASWVGDDAETAEEPDSQRQWTQPRAVNCWGGDDAGSAVQHDMKASASVRTRPRPRPRPQPGSERSPATSRFVSTTTTVGLTAAAAQSTDLVQNGKGHLPAKAWRASPKRTPLASAPMCTRRLNLDAANPNSEHSSGAGKGQGRIQGSPAQLGRLISLSRPPSPCPGGSGGASGKSGGKSCGSAVSSPTGASGMSEASKQYLLSMSLTPIQSTRQLQAGKSAPARAVLAAVEHTRVAPPRQWRWQQQQLDTDAAEELK
jgi:hypothetical protein